MTGDVSDDAERREDFEGTPTFNSIGGGAGAAKELVTFFQGLASGSRKVTSTSGAGFTIDDQNSPLHQVVAKGPSPNNDEELFVPNSVLMLKVFLSDAQDLNSAGLSLVTDSTSGYWEFLLFDDGTAPNRFIGKWPATRSWVIVPFDLDKFFYGNGSSTDVHNELWKTAPASSASSSRVAEIGVIAGVATGAAKSANLFMDSYDLSDGLYLTGGTQSPDSPATAQDFIDYDEGTEDNRIGHCTTREGVVYWIGRVTIGRTSPLNSPADSPQPTYFNDSNKTIVFEDGRFRSGWQRIEIDLTDPATEIIFDSYNITGRGRGIKTNRITVADGFDDVANEIFLPDVYESGDTVYFENRPTRSPMDTVLAEGQIWLGRLSAGVYGAYGTNGATVLWSDTWTDTNRLSFTQTVVNSPSDYKYFRLWNDTRPDLVVVVNASPAGTFLIDKGVYQNMRKWILAPEATIQDAVVINISLVEQNGATIDGADFQNPLLIEIGDAIVDSDDPGLISNSIFNFPDPAAVDSNDGHAIRITVPGTYDFVGNSFPGGWGADDSDTAMILNDSGGLVTLNVTDASSPTVKNAPNSPENVTVVNNNVSVTITNIQPLTEVRVFLAEDFTSPIDTTELAGIEDTGSPTEFAFSAPAGTVVDIVIHNVQYLLPPNNRIKNFTVPSSATSFPIQQLIDRTFDNP